MAKLFVTVESDRADKHQIANRFLELKIYYGSKDDSKLLTHILVKHESTVQFFQYSTIQPRPMEMRTQ